MNESTRMKINDYGDFVKGRKEPCLLTAETECEGGGVVNNV